MFEKLKQKLLERIERDAMKSECTYRPTKNSEPITETVYMKRSKMPLTGDWQRIYPPVNEDGSWNFINLIFGGKKNLIRLIFIGALIAMVLFGFSELFNYIDYLKGLIPPEIIIG
jgi:hypothetical protein